MNYLSGGLLAKVEKIKKIMSDSVTGTNYSELNQDYKKLRDELFYTYKLKENLPKCVQDCRDLKEFWDFISEELGTGQGIYQTRRKFISEQFNPLLTMIEEELIKDNLNLSTILATVDSEHIQQAWNKALERKYSDPEGAITMARTLLETTCKHILDQSLVDYDTKAELPELYRKTIENIQLAPSDYTKDSFRKIFGSCQSIVSELGSLRNRLSDAHGRGIKDAKPKEHHAELAVNLAGSMAIFLIKSWEENQDDW